MGGVVVQSTMQRNSVVDFREEIEPYLLSELKKLKDDADSWMHWFSRFGPESWFK
jgi:hypothetical protein